MIYPSNNDYLVIPTLDGNVHVLPSVVVEDWISGDAQIESADDWEELVKAIASEWLQMLRNKNCAGYRAKDIPLVTNN